MKKIITLLLLSFIFINSNSQSLELPYNTGFDSEPEQKNWLQFREGVETIYNWKFSGGGFSSQCLSHDYNVGANAEDTLIDWFISPALNFSSTGKISLKVKTNGFSIPFPDNCEVWFGSDDADPSKGNYKLIGNISSMDPKNTWLDTTFDIPYTAAKGFIAFKYKTIGAAWSTYAIDNVSITLDNNASVKEILNANSFTIFPNPTQNTATISISEELISNNLSLKIYDILGKEISHFENINSNQINLSNENLTKGIYIVKLLNNSEIIGSQKLLIQ